MKVFFKNKPLLKDEVRKLITDSLFKNIIPPPPPPPPIDDFIISKLSDSYLTENNVDESLTMACEEWFFDRSSTAYFFRNSKSITAEEKHAYLSTLQCEKIGTLTRNDSTFSFTINAGGWMELWFNNRFLSYYSCEDCKEMFLIDSEEE